jgi:hypothetical protein
MLRRHHRPSDFTLDRDACGESYSPSCGPGVRWQSGDASDCKSADAGSIPARTSSMGYRSARGRYELSRFD